MESTEQTYYGSDWDVIAAALPRNYKVLADQHRLIRLDLQNTIGAKVKDIDSILRVIFYHVATGASLVSSVGLAAAAGILAISAVALHKWMRKIGDYAGELLESLALETPGLGTARVGGYRVQLVDASVVNRPGACGTTNRIHYALELPSLRPSQIHVTTELAGETFRNFKPSPGELWIGDRAYANPPGIDSVVREDADVLVRHNRGSLPIYDVRGKPVDTYILLGKLRGLRAGDVTEQTVHVRPQGRQAISGRLVITRLPVEKAREAKNRVRREHRGKITKAAIRAAEFLVLFTTVPRDRLTKQELAELYRTRWQIELSFKRDKSIAGLDELPNIREDTRYSWLTIKLLLILLAAKVARTKANSREATQKARHSLRAAA